MALQEEHPKIFALLLWRKSPRLLQGPRVRLLWTRSFRQSN